MSAADHLGTYAEGWTKGDAATILRSVCDDYTHVTIRMWARLRRERSVNTWRS